MTIPFWCVLAVLVLNYLLAVTGGVLRIVQLGRLDNHYPRDQALLLKGIGARVWAAQSNGWEALAGLTAAVAVAHLAGADADASALAALVFVAARIAHALCYLSNLATLRTVVFLIGLGALGRIFWLAASAGA